jgi:hypothetical protein
MNGSERRLTIAAIAFVAANIVHSLDHVRQGFDGVTTEVLLGGSVLTLLALATLWFALRRDPQAPFIAAVVGSFAAVGVAAAHIPPGWGVLSDSYPDIHADALSWIVMLLEVGAAMFLAISGFAAMRRQRRQAQHA